MTASDPEPLVHMANSDNRCPLWFTTGAGETASGGVDQVTCVACLRHLIHGLIAARGHNRPSVDNSVERGT